MCEVYAVISLHFNFLKKEVFGYNKVDTRRNTAIKGSTGCLKQSKFKTSAVVSEELTFAVSEHLAGQ